MNIFSNKFKNFSHKAIIPLVFVLLIQLMPFSFSRADQVTDMQQQEIDTYLQFMELRRQLETSASALRESLRPSEPISASTQQPAPSPSETPPTASEPSTSQTGNTQDPATEQQSSTNNQQTQTDPGSADQAQTTSSGTPAASGETTTSTPNSTSGNSSSGSGGGAQAPFEGILANLHSPTTDVSVSTNATTTSTSTPQGIDITNGGDDSINTASNSETDQDTIETGNNANVSNTKEHVADSGNNTISCNGICEGKLTTGSATADSSSGNKINTSNVSSSSGGEGATWAWMRYGIGPDSGIENGGDDAINIGDNTFVKDLAIIQKNDAMLQNQYQVVANTGGNDILTTFKLKDFEATTGDARSRLTLMNMVNTNLLDSEWWPLYIGIDKEHNQNIDLMDELVKQFGSTSKFNLFSADPSAQIHNTGDDSFNQAISNVQLKINANSENSGLIQNKIRVACNTGHNTASSPYKIKDLNLTTGDCEASLTLLNFLNTYLVNSQWVTTVINVFGNWTQDLVLPSPTELLDISPESSASRGRVSIHDSGDDSFSKAMVFDRTQNDVLIKSDLNVNSKVVKVSNTGGDIVAFSEDLEDTSIKTGNATNLSSQFTIGNTAKVDGSFFSLVVNDLTKQWNGGIVGAPEDASVVRDETGVVITAERSGLTDTRSTIAGNTQRTTAQITNSGDDSMNVAGVNVDRHLIINSSHNGQIVNDASIEAYSGENIITGLDGRRISLNTGDTKTVTTIGNVVNTTMVGSKAMNIIVNVFGEWTGKVVFGKAVDLIVTMLSSATGQLQPGQDVTYTVHYENANDKEATTNAKLTANYDYQKMTLVDAGGATEVAPGKLEWTIGDVPALGSGSRTFKTRVKAGLPVGEHTIQATSEITSARPETNKVNNVDSASATVAIASAGSGPTTPPQNGNGEGTVGGAIIPGGNPSTSGSGQTGNTNSNTNSSNPLNGTGNSNGGQFGTPGGSNSNAGSAVTLKVDKRVMSSSVAKQGDVVKYRVTLQNIGSETARDVKVFDKLRVNGLSSPGDEFSWSIGDVPASEIVHVDYEVNIEPGAELGTYINTAYASGFDSRNKVVMSNDSQATVTVVQGQGSAVQGSGTQSAGTGSGTGGNADSQTPSNGSGTNATSTTATGGTTGNSATTSSLVTNNNQPSLDSTNHTSPRNVIIRNEDGTVRSNTNSTYGQARITRTIPIGIVTAQAQEIRVQPKNTNGASQEIAYRNLDKVLGEQIARENHYGFLMWLWLILLILLVVVGYLAWREQRKEHE